MDISIKSRWTDFGSRPAVLVLLVFLLGTAIYLPTLNYDFVWDDILLIKNNSQIQSLQNWPRLLLSYDNWQYTIFYRPLVMFSFALDFALFKFNPWGYHLTNSLLHGLNSALVAFLAWLLFRRPGVAALSGLCFAFHPAHPEAVALIAARADLLSTLFSLLALAVIIKQPESQKAWGAFLWAPLFLFLALLCKETSVVILIPMALWLYRQSTEKSPRLHEVMLKIMPWGLALLLYFLLRSLVVKAFLFKSQELILSPFFLFELFWRYLSFLIFPRQQVSYLYNVPQPYTYPLSIKFWAALILTLVLLALVVYLIYRKRETAPLLALLFLPLLPSLYFNLHKDTIMMERYLYLSTVGLALLLAWSFLRVPGEKKKWAALGAGVLIITYGVATLWRTPLWKNELVLFEAFKKEYPSSPFVRSALGSVYKDQGRLGEAYQEITAAVNLEPRHPHYHTSLGWLYIRLGQPQKAQQELALALNTVPDYALALEGMGIAYMQEGNFDLALSYLDKAVAADPKNETIFKNRNLVFRQKERLKKQREIYE